MHVPVCERACTCSCVHVCPCMCTCMYMFVCACMYMFVCMHVHVRVCVCVSMRAPMPLCAGAVQTQPKSMHTGCVCAWPPVCPLHVSVCVSHLCSLCVHDVHAHVVLCVWVVSACRLCMGCTCGVSSMCACSLCVVHSICVCTACANMCLLHAHMCMGCVCGPYVCAQPVLSVHGDSVPVQGVWSLQSVCRVCTWAEGVWGVLVLSEHMDACAWAEVGLPSLYFPC